MNKRFKQLPTGRTVLLAAAGLIWAAMIRPGFAAHADRPNFVVIFVDDLGYGDLGCYWRAESGVEKIETPNIDRMAREGAQLANFYVAASVCSPSRAALLTGCYPVRLGYFDGETGGWRVNNLKSRFGLNPEEVTIAELLKTRGYATAAIGKWHLGHLPPFLPTRQGFDSYYGAMFRAKDRVFADVMRNEHPDGVVKQSELTRRYTEAAVRFIRRNQSRPFFLYLAHNMPHPPIAVADEFRGRSKRGRYGDAVTYVDWSTGEILNALRKYHLDRKTLVIFTSDNGPEDTGPLGGNAFPLRRGKASVFEGGMRVPCIMWWPGRVPARECTAVTATIDVFPTLAALAGVDASVMPAVDGFNIWPRVTGTVEHPVDRTYFYYQGANLLGVRRGRWKLLLGKHSGAVQARRPFRLLALYDLDADPGERVNRIHKYAGTVRELVAAAELIRAELGDNNTGWSARGRRPLGWVYDPY